MIACVNCVGYCSRGDFEASKDAILAKIDALPAAAVASVMVSSKPEKGEFRRMAL